MKKIASLLLAVIVCTSLVLSSCSPKNDEQQTNSSDNAAVSDEKVKLSFIAALNPATEDLNNSEFLKSAADEANVEISYECIFSDWSTKKAALLAAGDLPDAFVGAWVFTPQEVGANRDLFLPLQDLIKNNAPDIQKVIDADKNYKTVITELDSTIFYLTAKSAFRPMTYTSLQMNQEWLKNLNLKVPTTLEEFEAVLKAFKEKDANGNGDPNDEIPMYMSLTGDEAWSTMCFMGSFDCATSITSKFVVKNDKVVYQPITENYKKYVTWLAKLKTEGLMPEEVATAKWAQVSATLGNDVPIVGVTNAWLKDPINVAYQDQYAAIAPLTGPDGARFIAGSESAAVYEIAPSFVLSKTCKNPEAVIKFINSFYTPEKAIQINFGPVGKTLELVNDKYNMVDPPEGMDWDTWLYKNSVNGGWPCYISKEAESLFAAIPHADSAKMGIDEINRPFVKLEENIPVLKFNEDEIAELAIIETDINKYVDKMVAEWFVNGNVEGTWDKYIAELDKMGMPRYIEIYQTAYDAQK